MRAFLSRIQDLTRSSPGELGVAALLGAVVVAGSALVFFKTSATPAPPLVHEITRSPAPILTVHVAGLVLAPGVYELPSGSRIRDAIDAAGGAVDGADLDSLNLAELLSDGQKVLVQARGAPQPGQVESQSESSGKVNLNSATAKQLEELPGVGPVLAERIIAYRNKVGRFTSIRQLMEVEGIGTKKFESLKSLVTV